LIKTGTIVARNELTAVGLAQSRLTVEICQTRTTGGSAMTIRRYVFLCALVLVAGLAPRPSDARSIRVDMGNWTCGATAVSQSTLPFNSGLGTDPFACTTATSDQDFQFGVGPFEFNPAATTLYEYGNPSVNWNDNVQVVEYTLDSTNGTYSGDTEVQFNYNSGAGCLVTALATTPTLIMGGTTYRLSPATATAACANTDDFLFNGSGGFVGWIDATGAVNDTLQNSGWTVVTTSVPEPDSLALLAFAFAMVFLMPRRLRVGR
jgi:hypothetical protein